MAAAVQIVVNGLAGPRCTVEATTEWTVLQVHEAICEKISIPVQHQMLVKDSEKLSREATVGSLLADDGQNSLQLFLVVQEVRPINFVGLQNGLEQVEPGHLRKTGGDPYSSNASAVSSESIAVGQARGLRFRPGTADRDFFIGLGTRSSAPTHSCEIDYAVCCGDHGWFYVLESGAQKSGLCPYGDASVVELRLSGTQVEFVLDGEAKYPPLKLRGQEPLYALAAFYHIGAEALEIQWL